MGNRPHDYRLHIDAFTPATLPMARLAEYMGEFAGVLGRRRQVHFVALEEGSAVLRAQVEERAWHEVNANLEAAIRPGSETNRFYENLNRLLAEDQTTAEIIDFSERVVLRLEGRDRPVPLDYPSFRERGSIDGELVRIGGKDATVHATLAGKERTYRCQMNRELARQMAACLFGGTVRVFGSGRWKLGPDGEWSLEQFDAEAFELLDDDALIESVRRIRDRAFRLDAEVDIYEELANARRDH